MLALKHVRHKNIVDIHDMFIGKTTDNDVSLNYVMQYYKNGDLEKYWKAKNRKKSKFSEAKIVDYLLQISSALT
jgi:serine/threonine protein kinase